MTATGAYDRHSHGDANAEIQRLALQARSKWGKEACALLWFGLQDGISVHKKGGCDESKRSAHHR